MANYFAVEDAEYSECSRRILEIPNDDSFNDRVNWYLDSTRINSIALECLDEHRTY